MLGSALGVAIFVLLRPSGIEELYGKPPPDIDARIELLIKSYPQ